MFPGLKIEEVCKFDDQRPLDALTGSGVAGIVVNDVQVAQRMVYPVETDVGAETLSGGVILNKRVEKCVGSETVNKTGSKQIRRPASIH
jgi:hypothetical protein